MSVKNPSSLPYITVKPAVPATPWVRPLDWITILPPPPNEVIYLVSDISPIYTISTTFTRTASQNIYIDWGDGVINTVSSLSTSTTHTYTVGGGTPCSRGYTTWKIRVYGDLGATISNVKFIQTPNYTSLPIGLLEGYHGNGTLSTASSLFYTQAGGINATYLEYFKFPDTMITATGPIFNETFFGCRALSVVVMPTSAPNNTSFSNTFNLCHELQSIVLPSDCTLVNTYANTFTACFNLHEITLPTSMNLVTNMSFTFQNTQIENITLPPLPLCATYQSAFASCLYLTYIKFTSFNVTPFAINFTNTFFFCTSLQQFIFPPFASTSTLTFASTFASCYNLKNITIPTNVTIPAAGFASTFSSCFSLLSVSLPTTMPSVTSFASTFQNCTSLQSITLPTTVGASIVLSSTFNGCYSLSEIVIPNSYNITLLLSTFQTCTNAHIITLPSGPQNSLTSLSSCFNGCNSLINVTLPSSMTLCNNISNMFSNCFSLQSVTLPSTMNAVTTSLSAFSDCRNLRSATLPTSMTSCTIYTSMFLNCFNINSITMPSTTVATVTNFSQCFQNCTSLTSVTLPTTQMTSVTTINSMFNSCYLLRTITNFDKLGNTSALVGNVTYVDGSGSLTGAYSLTSSITSPSKYAKFDAAGASATAKTQLTSLRLTNTGAGQWGGVSPQINISYSNLSTDRLNTLFADMAAQPSVVSKTINITGVTGVVGLTPANRSVITNKGWTITG
jgi:hypothetical protein